MKRCSLEKNIFFLFDIVVLAIGLVILIYRISFGIDFTDQSWYVAEPYIVSEGAVPYADNWSQTPGFTIPLALFTKLYTFFTGSTEGIFLFSRIEYVIWLLAILGICFFLFNRNLDRERMPIFVLLPFLFITPHQLFDINYNNIGLVYLLLGCTVLFVNHEAAKLKIQFVKGLASGIIIARAVIGTPYILLPCAIIILFLCYEKAWSKLQGFICGGIVAAILVVGWCCFRVGVFKFINGLQYWFVDCPYFKLESDPFSSENFLELFSFLKIFILCIVFAYIMRRILKQDEVYESFLYILLTVLLILGYVQCLYTNDFKVLTYWGWFEPIVLYMFLPNSLQRRRMRLFSFIIVLYSSVFLFSSFGNIYGFGSREYWLYIPLIFSIAIIFSRDMKSVRTKIFFRISIILIAIMMIQLSYGYVYRDEQISDLTVKVESGIWKGLYTTENRALDVVKLEDYIRQITSKDDNILFMDWCPFGYLMSNGSACSPSTYDNLLYAHGTNLPQVMFDYFQEVEKTPDKIIYVDFGKVEKLSIEDKEWKFNKFVEENYMMYEVWESGMFRVKSYCLK